MISVTKRFSSEQCGNRIVRARSQKKAKILFWTKWSFASVIVLAFAGWLIFGEGGFLESRRLAREREAQAERIALVEARKLKIQAYLEKIEASDEFAMETAARRYGLVGPTENIYRIKVEPETKD